MAPAASATSSDTGIGRSTVVPTTTAVIPPATICPSPPRFTTPARNGTATASAMATTGTATEIVLRHWLGPPKAPASIAA